MSAARVLNPVVLSEFCKIRASPVTVSRNLPCSLQLNRVKRDLFGKVNSAETNKIFNEELEKHQDKAMKRWGFDFRAGCPLPPNSQFIWERVSFQESSFAPEMYTLTRVAHVRPTISEPSTYDMMMDERAERENFKINSSDAMLTDTDSCDDSHDEMQIVASSSARAVFKVPTLRQHTTQFQLRKRQPKITEYMKERKRLTQTPKKLSPPAKRMRTNSGGGSSSASGIATAVGNAHLPHHYQSLSQQLNSSQLRQHLQRYRNN